MTVGYTHRKALLDLMGNALFHQKHLEAKTSPIAKLFCGWFEDERVKAARLSELERHIASISAHLARADKESK
jgi:hypothetical protein